MERQFCSAHAGDFTVRKPSRLGKAKATGASQGPVGSLAKGGSVPWGNENLTDSLPSSKRGTDTMISIDQGGTSAAMQGHPSVLAHQDALRTADGGDS